MHLIAFPHLPRFSPLEPVVWDIWVGPLEWNRLPFWAWQTSIGRTSEHVRSKGRPREPSSSGRRRNNSTSLCPSHHSNWKRAGRWSASFIIIKGLFVSPCQRIGGKLRSIVGFLATSKKLYQKRFTLSKSLFRTTCSKNRIIRKGQVRGEGKNPVTFLCLLFAVNFLPSILS